MSEFQPLNAGLKSWNRARETIKPLYGDYTCGCPATSEVWQYLGTAGSFRMCSATVPTGVYRAIAMRVSQGCQAASIPSPGSDECR